MTVIFKAFNVLSDQEICQLIGVRDLQKLTPTLEECHILKIYTQNAALRYLGTKLVAKRFVTAASKVKSPMDDARDLLATTVLAHIPVEDYNFYSKAVYLAVMVCTNILLFANAHTIFLHLQKFFINIVTHNTVITYI